jgi:hypothetical protein
MKNTIKSTVSILLAVVFLFCFVSCSTVEKTGLWESATYRRDKTFGNGEKTCVVEVKAEDQVVTFTIKTDEEYLRGALEQENLIFGTDSDYGIYILTMDGETVDEANMEWWGYTKSGEQVNYGVDTCPILDGDHYEFVINVGW